MTNIYEIKSKSEPSITVSEVLDESRDLDVAVVIGWRGDDFFMKTSNINVSDNLLLLELAKRLALNVVFE